MRSKESDARTEGTLPTLVYGDATTARRRIGTADAISAALAIVVAIALGFIAAMLVIFSWPTRTLNVLLPVAFCLVFAGFALRAAWNHLRHGG